VWAQIGESPVAQLEKSGLVACQTGIGGRQEGYVLPDPSSIDEVFNGHRLIDPDIEPVSRVVQGKQCAIVARGRARIEVRFRVVLREQLLGSCIQFAGGDLIVGKWHAGERVHRGLARNAIEIPADHRLRGYVIDDQLRPGLRLPS